MKRYLLCTLFLTTSLFGEGNLNPITNDLPKDKKPKDQLESAEIRSLDNLILVTEENLAAQEKLRLLLIDYQALRKASLKDQKNKEQIDALVSKALEIQTLIQDNYLFHVFDADFLSELNLFAGIASKSGLPQPTIK
jgi:hypothetical protein